VIEPSQADRARVAALWQSTSSAEDAGTLTREAWEAHLAAEAQIPNADLEAILRVGSASGFFLADNDDADADAAIAAAIAAHPAAAPAPTTKDFNPDQPRADNGQFGSGGGGADDKRSDGKAKYRDPSTIPFGSKDHPNVRDEKPQLSTSSPDYKPGTRTDPAMWEHTQQTNDYSYLGQDHTPVHEWPAPKYDTELESDKFIQKVDGDTGKNALAAVKASTDCCKAYPTAQWMLEQHPLPMLFGADTVVAGARADHVNGVYEHVRRWRADGTSEVLHEESRVGLSIKSTFDRSRQVNPGVTMSSGQKPGEDRAKIVFLHEIGHHLSTAPGVEKHMQEGWDKRVKSDRGVTEYAKTNADEYFAETWAAYNMDALGLAERDYDGFTMIERSLATLEK
jgi:hypothetical protein